ncbi:MAG: MerR family transcriptional regulator [Chloroflexaceae bacterium]|jgi:DNA-binding transcriptional MerR regulator|nr:MerR family transcriptional regulator [Chloroflexaceae bacterium]
MFKISEFARLSRTSAKMLRYYDEIGLLKPTHTDPTNDYRYYSADQLPRLNRIIVLKELGFGLEQIARLLDDDLSVAQMQGMLMLRRAEVEQQIAREQARLSHIAARLRQIEREGQLPAYDVVLQATTATPVAALDAVVDEHEIYPLLYDVERHVARQQVRASAPPVLVYHGCDGPQMHVEIAVPVSGLFQETRHIRQTSLPAVQLMACTVYTGLDAEGCDAWRAVGEWVHAHGYRMVGPSREVCLRLPGDAAESLPTAFVASQPSACVTELQFPVEKER